MKVDQTSDPSPDETYVLAEGDRITCGITHEIMIAGEKSWVKYEVNSAVRAEEAVHEATTRVIRHVNATALEAVRETVDAVRKATG
jgi:hypothetical protein